MKTESQKKAFSLKIKDKHSKRKTDNKMETGGKMQKL
jgi:hypothetical protein